MRYVVYFVPREGVHPHATLDDYRKLFPIMHESVRGLGHKLVHLTDLTSPCLGDEVWRTDVSARTTVFSRDVAWARYVEALPDGEQACMIEPDTLMLKDIPGISDGYDMVVLRRPQSCVPGWFKLARNTAAPLLWKIVDNYQSLSDEMHVFHGDINALHAALSIPDGQTAHTIPSVAEGVRIEVRDWDMYGFRKTSGQFFLQFKGTSKRDMLAHAR